MQLNSVPKTGGNTFTGLVQLAYANENFQSDNTTGRNIEGGPVEPGNLVRFQIRPDPLARYRRGHDAPRRHETNESTKARKPKMVGFVSLCFRG